MAKYARSTQSGYGLSSPLPGIFPSPIISNRAPTVLDTSGPLGQVWIRENTNQTWILTSVAAGAATWALASPGASDVDTLTGDAGGPISPAVGNINLLGGTNIGSTGAGNTITFNLDPAIVLATSVTAPLYTAAAADALIVAGGVNDVVCRLGDAAGATFFRVQDSTSADVFTVDSNGGLAAFLGLTVTGAFTQTAGAVNVGMDNLGSAINIGGGNVIKAIAIGGGAAAHTLTLGGAAAGAMTLDSAAGISIDAATASNFTVTGATQDLTLRSTGGSININATESIADAIIINASGAASSLNVDAGTNGITIDTTGGFSIDGATASNITVTGAGLDLTLSGVGGAVNVLSDQTENDAIMINASAANGGVQIHAGTGGILIGDDADTTGLTFGNIAPTATRNITIGSGTVVTAAVTDTINVGTGGATTNVNSIKVVNIGTGGVTLGEMLTNIATGNVTSGTHTTSIASGNRAAGTMALNLMTGTGTKNLNFGNADGLTTINVRGPLAIDGVAGAVTVSSAGAVSLNSTAAAINVGDGANNFAVNVGTAGVRTVTVGSVTGASATIIQSGTGRITMTGTIKEVTTDFVNSSGVETTFSQSPVGQSNLNTGVAPTGANTDVNLLAFRSGFTMEEYIIGTQTIIMPRMDANGLLVSLDLTVAEGAEYSMGANRANSWPVFTIGTSAAFYFQLRFRINDMDGADPYIFGFRKVEANNATWTNYTDYATMGMIASTSPTQIILATELNSGGTTITNTTNNWGGDGTTNTLGVYVSAAGVVTYLINGVAPVVTAAFTFDNGDVVAPFVRITHSASPTQVNLVSMKIGYQP